MAPHGTAWHRMAPNGIQGMLITLALELTVVGRDWQRTIRFLVRSEKANTPPFTLIRKIHER